MNDNKWANDKWWLKDEDYANGIVAEVNRLRRMRYFITYTPSSQPQQGFFWVSVDRVELRMDRTISKIFSTSKEALVDLIATMGERLADIWFCDSFF